MHTILLFTHTPKVKEQLTRQLEGWEACPLLLSAGAGTDPGKLISSRSVGLVILELPATGESPEKTISRLTHRFPWLPFIVVTARRLRTIQEMVLTNGASACIPLPLVGDNLVLKAKSLLEVKEYGPLQSIPLHSYLQILKSEHTTCTLEAAGPVGKKGWLFLKNGTLIDAETEALTGEEAALEIMGWPDLQLRLRFFNDQRGLRIHRPGLELIMEAFEKRSEQEKRDSGTGYARKHQLVRKHFFTLDTPVSVHSGTTVTLQLQGNQTPLSATVAGMLQDNYFIVTTPQPERDFDSDMDKMDRVLIKFIHNGRTWMFKTRLLQQVRGTTPLLIFEYPSVLHCYELRKAKRTSIFLPSTFHFENNREFYGALINISAAGSLCQIKHHPERPMPVIKPGTLMLLRCLLPGIKEEQMINCRVRNVNVTEETTNVGVEFEKMPTCLLSITNRFQCQIPRPPLHGCRYRRLRDKSQLFSNKNSDKTKTAEKNLITDMPRLPQSPSEEPILISPSKPKPV
ncbi:flagellar brake domain-containing protein [Desulforhopalus vacuolatus]|uniref:flagellar brake domain-containing protein n=1 Tax=Desulforhopalus vacuolatus TaxID=40414 RepID=UPI001963488C|nr:flagellar brake domain-containing protein [Desulforhopalus vacuolatus]MBM9519705.1 flagellar brake domain-containing protein [Desulforhopalus vacuolatus]